MANDDEYQLKWDVDADTGGHLRQKDLVGLEDLDDAEILDWLFDWASDEAIQNCTIHVRNSQGALEWIKSKLKKEG
jgi:hypothetical protein